jgi:hypothetical protein
MIYYIEENKELLRIELKDLLIMNEDETLNNIETKLNDTLKAIENYKSHFEGFVISQDIKNFLDNFVDNNILSFHTEIKKILDDRTKNIILDYLNISSDNFKQAYNFENMESQLNDSNDLFKNQYFDKMIQFLKEYGIIDKIYLDNLKKALINEANSSIRILEESNENLANLKFEQTFKQLKETSQHNKLFIQSIDIFSNFNDKIDKYINNIKEQYETSKNNIKERKYTEEVNELLYQSLEELKELSISYYNKVKLKYKNIKEYIENSVSYIDNLIEKSNEITDRTINDKYQEIKNNFNKINNKVNNETKKEPIIYNNNEYKVDIKINNFINNNEFNFEIEDEKLIGKSINKNRPDSFEIDFSSKIGKCIMKGKKMTMELNNVSSSVIIDYDINSTETKIIKDFYLDQYIIKNNFYNETEKITKTIVAGIPMQKVKCVPRSIETPTGEKEEEIVEAKKENIEKILL